MPKANKKSCRGWNSLSASCLASIGIMKYPLILIILIGFTGSAFAFSDEFLMPATDANSENRLESEKSFAISIHQTATFYNLQLTFTGVEDSRCPSDVTCIWEGQVTATFDVHDGNQNQVITFTTGKVETVHVGSNKIQLIDITPHPTATEDISEKYVATIVISKNNTANLPAPLKQISSGTALSDVVCNEGLILVQKYDDTPACVREQSAQKLIKRGWALQNDRQTGVMAPLSETIPEQNVANSAGLSIMPEMINGKNYLVFEGVGWHKLHSVEITITDNDGKKAASIRSKTNSNGVLHMPWSLPEDLPRGLYRVHATDGIRQNNFVFSIPVEAPVNVRTDSSELNVDVSGEKQVRRGTTHSIEIQVDRDKNPVDDAQVFIRIEDYGEDIVREFHGRTNQQGYFVFSWEIPKKFDDIETLLAFVDVTDGISSKTELFKFVVYCLPGETGCKVEGN